MAQVQDPERLAQLIEKLFERRVEATIKVVRVGDEGMEAEVVVESTGELTSLAYSLAQRRLVLSYDGNTIKVFSDPEEEEEK